MQPVRMHFYQCSSTQQLRSFLVIYQNFGRNQKHYFKTSDNKLWHGWSCMYSEKKNRFNLIQWNCYACVDETHWVKTTQTKKFSAVFFLNNVCFGVLAYGCDTTSHQWTSVSHFCSVFYNVSISRTLLVGQLNMLNQCLAVDERDYPYWLIRNLLHRFNPANHYSQTFKKISILTVLSVITVTQPCVITLMLWDR